MKFNLFFWKKNAAIDQFAHTIAAELFSRVQPDQMEEYLATATNQAITDKKTAKAQLRRDQVTQVINETILQVQHFRTAYGLGIYGKARLHLTFTERLKELGYSDPVATEINRIILIRTP